MPELPEVESARRHLARWLSRGSVITVAELPARLFHGGAARTFAAKLRGRAVEKIERRGKWLRIAFDEDVVLFSHLGMTGKWVLRKHDDPVQRFEQARLDTKTRSLRYLDPRQLGHLYGFVGDGEPRAWRELGPDALTDEIDIVQLHNKIQRRGKSIKETLLDQTVVAGVGNIQAAEALWRAKINPERIASSLSLREVAALVSGIIGSIKDTIEQQRVPEIKYVEEGGENFFAVYGKQGEPCPRCRRTLERIIQGGRSTVFCPRCQPRRKK